MKNSAQLLRLLAELKLSTKNKAQIKSLLFLLLLSQYMKEHNVSFN